LSIILPKMIGSIIDKTWLHAANKSARKIVWRWGFKYFQSRFILN
jgi:hypothetical protein